MRAPFSRSYQSLTSNDVIPRSHDRYQHFFRYSNPSRSSIDCIAPLYFFCIQKKTSKLESCSQWLLYSYDICLTLTCSLPTSKHSSRAAPRGMAYEFRKTKEKHQLQGPRIECSLFLRAHAYIHHIGNSPVVPSIDAIQYST